MFELNGKKLLIIGGAYQHMKLVETAKALGIATYVTDYLTYEHAPAKQIADRWYDIDIYDTDRIVSLCLEEKIDGVLSCNLDACQKPYYEVCEKLGLPCYGTREQFELLTEKPKFKKICNEYGLDTIPEYNIEQALSGDGVKFPIFIKPAESSSSKGQTICYHVSEVREAIDFAKRSGRTDEVVIEKYLYGYDDISISGLMIDGQLYVTRIADRFLGTGKMNKSEIVSIYPSRYTTLYKETVHERVSRMIREIGVKNGPIFFQGLIDGKTIRFYDPALRFPGAECELAYERIHGINLSEAMIVFALTGFIPEKFKEIANKTVPRGVHSLLMYFPICPGKIMRVEGEHDIQNNPDVVAFRKQYAIGDTVGEFYNASQRYGELDAVCYNFHAMGDMVDWVYDTLKIIDEKGNDMLFSKFDKNRLACYIEGID